MTYSPFFKALMTPAMALMNFAETYRVTEVTCVLNALDACKGNVLLTGVGKSGDIARKISSTLTSVGVRSFFLSPLDALHGSIGAIHDNDVLFMLSKSGETKELVDLAKIVAASFTTKMVLLTCGINSTLEQYAYGTIHYSGEECCSTGMIPTTTTTMALAIGDALAVALMDMRNFTLEQFSINHPGGTLGQRVRDSLERT